MDTMADDTKTADATSEPQRALFFELEYLATSGRTFLFESLKSVLADKGVDVTPVTFACYFAANNLPTALARLGRAEDVSGLDSSAVLDSIHSSYIDAIKRDGHRNKGLVTLTSDLKKHGIRLGALTCLDRDCVDGVLEQLGLSADEIYVMAAEDHGKAFPTAQDWLKLAKNMGMSTAMCTVAATSNAACRSALSAGMRCFAIPDELTSFQDFTGADYVLESLDATSEKLVLKLVEAF